MAARLAGHDLSSAWRPDLRLPDGSGLDLLPQFKELRPSPTVVMITAAAMSTARIAPSSAAKASTALFSLGASAPSTTTAIANPIGQVLSFYGATMVGL